MSDHAELIARIDGLTRQADAAWVEPHLMEQMNDVLCEGFACALNEEARLDQLEQRLSDVLSGSVAGRAAKLREVTVEMRATERSVSALRSRLAIMHARFIALAAGAPSRP